MKREVRLFDEIERFAKGYRLSNALAFTFGYDGEVAYERIWKPLIERFGVPRPIVVADGKIDAGRALGATVLRAWTRGGVFHPKLFVAIRDDAAMVAIGSANLTRGGLGGNLELLTTLHFGSEVERSGSRHTLESIAAFVESAVERIAASEASLEELRRTVRALRLIAEQLKHQPKAPRFVSSLEEPPLFEQLKTAHGESVRRLLVISPFWELDRTDVEGSDSLVCTAMDTLPWSSRLEEPRCVLYAGARGPGLRLPKTALEQYSTWTQLHLQASSREPRRLHAKLVALVGPKRTTLMWGSPNFTPAAMLRRAGDGGNVECALLWSLDAKHFDDETLKRELELEEPFDAQQGEIPEPESPGLMVIEDFVLGELLYDPRDKTLSLHGEVTSDRVRRVEVRMGDVLLLSVEDVAEGKLVARATVDVERYEEGDLRVLRHLYGMVKVLGDRGEVLTAAPYRFNVAFQDALEVHQNILLGADALSADALLVPTWAVPERRVAVVEATIARLRANGQTAGARRGGGHQPSLDTFYKNVRKGLAARRRDLEARRGSRFGLMRWSIALRASLDKARADALDPARLAYFVTRVSEHIIDVVDLLPKWKATGPDTMSVLEPAKLAESLEAAALTGDLLEDFIRTAKARQEEATNRLTGLS